MKIVRGTATDTLETGSIRVLMKAGRPKVSLGTDYTSFTANVIYDLPRDNQGSYENLNQEIKDTNSNTPLSKEASITDKKWCFFKMKLGSDFNFKKGIINEVLRVDSFYELDFSFEVLDLRRNSTLQLGYPSAQQLRERKKYENTTNTLSVPAFLKSIHFGFVGRMSLFRLVRNGFDLRNSLNRHEKNGLAVPNCFLGTPQCSWLTYRSQREEDKCED